MNSHSVLDFTRLAANQTLHLGRLGGELTVIDGRIWLTRDGDLDDHVVEPGQTLRLGADENGVIESAQAGESATVRWQPRGPRFLDGLTGLAVRTGFSALLHNRGTEPLRMEPACSHPHPTATPCARS